MTKKARSKRNSKRSKVYDKQAKLARLPEPISIGDIELEFRPLIDINYASLDSYIRSQHILTAVNAAKEIEQEDPSTAALIRQEAISQASSLSFFTRQGRSMINNIDGISRIAWEMAGGSNCKYSVKQIKEAILEDTNNEIASEIVDIFDSQNFEDSEDGGENDEEKK